MQEFADHGARHLTLTTKLLTLIFSSPSQATQLLREAQTAGLTFTDAHAPHSLQARPGSERTDTLKHLREALKITADFNIRTITIHVGNNGSYWDNYPLDQLYNFSLATLHELMPLAEELDLIIAIENIWHPTNVAEKLLAMITAFSSPHLGICYDTGHANLLRENRNYTNFRPGEPWERLGRIGWDNQILEKVLPHVTSAHLQDNHGDFDVHLAPGHGDINWPHITRLLKSAPRLTTLQCEVSPGHHNYTVADIIASIQKIWGHIHISEDRETMPFTPYT